jgi:integral membrane protein
MIYFCALMEKSSSGIFGTFLKIGHIEGVSYLLLLFVAMPLRTYADMPKAVTIGGYIHGVLFIAYCVILAITMHKLKWSFTKGLFAFILSLIPFGTFWLNRFR